MVLFQSARWPPTENNFLSLSQNWKWAHHDQIHFRWLAIPPRLLNSMPHLAVQSSTIHELHPIHFHIYGTHRWIPSTLCIQNHSCAWHLFLPENYLKKHSKDEPTNFAYIMSLPRIVQPYSYLSWLTMLSSQQAPRSKFYHSNIHTPTSTWIQKNKTPSQAN